MDPIVAVHAIKLTTRAPEGADVPTVTNEQIGVACEQAVMDLFERAGATVTTNATSVERTDD